MFPVIFRIGDFAITSFGLMMFLSFVSGAWVQGKQLERYKIDKEVAWDMLAWTAIAGILGAKLYYLGLHWDDLVAHPFRELTSRGGLVWYGGLIGGVTAFYLQARKLKFGVARLFDSAAPALAVAYAVGRLGCFLVGDDYGQYTTSWVGIKFPEGSPPSTAANLRLVNDHGIPANIPGSEVLPVHPTQLYEIGLSLIIFAIVWQVGKRKLKPGQLFALWMFLYAIERFCIEFVRAKGDRFVFGLSTSQVASIILFGAAIYLAKRQASENPTRSPA